MVFKCEMWRGRQVIQWVSSCFSREGTKTKHKQTMSVVVLAILGRETAHSGCLMGKKLSRRKAGSRWNKSLFCRSGAGGLKALAELLGVLLDVSAVEMGGLCVGSQLGCPYRQTLQLGAAPGGTGRTNGQHPQLSCIGPAPAAPAPHSFCLHAPGLLRPQSTLLAVGAAWLGTRCCCTGCGAGLMTLHSILTGDKASHLQKPFGERERGSRTGPGVGDLPGEGCSGGGHRLRGAAPSLHTGRPEPAW